jgi:hypothetical protein
MFIKATGRARMPLLRNRNIFMRYYFRAESLRDAGIGSGKICKGGTSISSLKWLGNVHMTSL